MMSGSIFTQPLRTEKSLKFFRYTSLHFMGENICFGIFINSEVSEGGIDLPQISRFYAV